MDPLKPFSELIRTISSATGPRRVGGSAGSSAAPADRAGSGPAASGLQEQLAARLRGVDPDDFRRARTVFIETVLAREFGAQFALDPAFGDLVRRIDEHLAGQTALNSQLQSLLRGLSAP